MRFHNREKPQSVLFMEKVVLPSGTRDVYPLVVRLASKVWGLNGDIGSAAYQDAVSEGLVALLISEKKFRKSRRVKLTTFAYRRVHGAVKDLIKREAKYTARFERFAPQDLPGLAACRDGTENRVSNKLLFLKVIKIIQRILPEKHREVLLRYYLAEKAEVAIATELGITVWSVTKVRGEALEMVRRFFPATTGTMIASDDN